MLVPIRMVTNMATGKLKGEFISDSKILSTESLFSLHDSSLVPRVNSLRAPQLSGALWRLDGKRKESLELHFQKINKLMPKC